MSLTDFADLVRENDYLRKENLRLARRSHRAAARREEFREALYTALQEWYTAHPLAPVAAPRRKEATQVRQRTPETALLVLSDWHVGAQTASFDASVCAARVDRYVEKVKLLTGIMRAHHPVREARVYLLGDMVHGELIYPGEPWEVEASQFAQSHLIAPRILTDALRKLLGYFDRITVFGVSGNHGAVGGEDRRRYHRDTNFDAMLYQILAYRFESEPRIEFCLKPREHWFAVDTIGSKRYLLLHGYQFAIKNLMSFTSVGHKINGWLTGALDGPFDYVLMGHYHSPTRLSLNHRRVYINGTLETDSPFAREQLAMAAQPSQYLLFAHPERGVTWENEVFLDDLEDNA